MEAAVDLGSDGLVRPPWGFALVCRRMRIVALDTGRLWTDVLVDWPENLSYIGLRSMEDRLQEQLDRSRQFPLRVCFRYCLEEYDYWEDALPLLELLAASSNRWQDTDFCILHTQLHLLNPIYNRLPLLSSLLLAVLEDYEPRRSEQFDPSHEHLLFSMAPSLRVATLDVVEGLEYNIVLPPSGHRQLKPCRTLTIFIHAALWETSMQPPPPHCDPIALPFLRSLALPSLAHLATLDTPQLESLRLQTMSARCPPPLAAFLLRGGLSALLMALVVDENGRCVGPQLHRIEICLQGLRWDRAAVVEKALLKLAHTRFRPPDEGTTALSTIFIVSGRLIPFVAGTLALLQANCRMQ
ncbi:hypothetical protein C8R43DRAFT_942814 [Mycena crocata]|nr:hypothetical protein C8R43DRAFT_942814 [Mycena crocata]